MLAGCGAEVLTNTPTLPSPIAVPLKITPAPFQTPTTTPEYIHYTSLKEPNIHLEFDYPGSWIFNNERPLAGAILVGLWDPRFLTLHYEDDRPMPNDFGSVDIWVETVESGQPLDTLFESYKQGHDGSSWITLLDEYKLTVDGYDASVLEYQIGPIEFYTSLMFERNVFFVVKDQMYQITFTVSEKERDGEFEKGYEYFFNSLKIMP